MGKYMKKPKISTSSDVALMKQPQHHSSHGVRTRAKTNNLINSDDASCFSYLQLRSRRLPKIFAAGKSPAPAPAAEGKSRGECCGGNPKIENSKGRESDEVNVVKGSDDVEESVDICMESSFAENVSEVEEKDRNTGDSHPCSFTRDFYTMSTPASSTKKILCEHVPRNIPMAYEIEEFFAFAEKQHHRIFMEKYNFDIVNDVPLSGRYEWVQVLH